MRRLEDRSRIERVAVMLAIVAIVVLLLLVLAWLFNSEAGGQALPPKGTFVGKPSLWDEHLVELDRIALDSAYTDQLHHLFLNWMKDDSGQPDRAVRGAQQARRAYILVRTAIEERGEVFKKLKE